MKKKIIGVIVAVMILNGCYTQLSTIRREPPPEPVVTYEIDSLGDTVKVVRQTDTVTKDRENGYWTRNLWGEAEWRSGSPYYSHSWYLYNDYPWWYNSYPYYYDNSGRCPQYYYWDNGCSSCRRFEDNGFYRNDQNRRSSGGGTVVGPSVNRQPQHRSRVSPEPQISTNPRPTGASKMLSSDAKNQATGGAGSGAPVQSAPPPSGTIQSSPPPASSPSPPPSNNGGSENKERNHRNPRSF